MHELRQSPIRLIAWASPLFVSRKELEVLGENEFFEIFGGITIGTVVKWLLAIFFVVYVAFQIKKFAKGYFDKKTKLAVEKAELEKKRDKDLSEALAGVRKYPEYRKQSIEIQKELKDENKKLNESVASLEERMRKMEEDTRRRERKKIQDTLLQNYRYYTNPETNPTRSWSRMESNAFWELFEEYEENGGDGYMHTVVQPEMNKLIIVEHEPNEQPKK